MKKLAKCLILGLIAAALWACNSKSTKQTQATDTPEVAPDTTAKQNKPEPKAEPTLHAEMKFIDYNDDGDYFQFIAQQGDSIHYFINNDNTDRKLNRGDLVDITWKHGIITMAGDDDKPVPAEMLVSVKKIADGALSKFKKTYNKPLKYTWSQDEQYSKDYLDKIYKLVEYYLANTKNDLLKIALKRSDITFSIEENQRDGRNYTLAGIAPVGENGANVAEWLYIDTETHKLYLFDQAEDTLREFK